MEGAIHDVHGDVHDGITAEAAALRGIEDAFLHGADEPPQDTATDHFVGDAQPAAAFARRDLDAHMAILAAAQSGSQDPSFAIAGSRCPEARSLPPDRGGGDSLEQPVAEDGVEIERVEMDVADVATADVIRAGTFHERSLEALVINIADGLFDEMAAAHGSISIHREYGRSCPARFPTALVMNGIDREQRIHLAEALDVVGEIIA